MKYLSIILVALSISACAQKVEKKSENEKQQTLPENLLKQNNMNENNNPEIVIKSLIEAMSENNAAKIRSLFAENASQAYGDSPSKSGKDFFKWLESDIIERNGHVENVKYEVDGNSVIVTGQYSSKGYTNKANFLFSVEDGKIMSWQMRY